MKMAKASAADIDALDKLFNTLERIDPSDINHKEIDNETLGRFVRWAMQRNHIRSGWRRVVWGAEALIREVCDPDESCLEYKPELKKLIPPTKNERGETLFYVLSYKHSKENQLAFWRANDAGYTDDIIQAGTYTGKQIRAQLDYYHNYDRSVAVSVAEFHERYRIRHQVEVDYKQKAIYAERVAAGVLTDEEPKPAKTNG